MTDITIHIENHKLINRAALATVMKGLADGSYIVSIKPRKKRTLSQNAYYHACVVPMVFKGLCEAGYDDVNTTDDAHEVMKSLFLKHQHVNKKDGLVLEGAFSTTRLSTVEFNEYKEKIQKWASEYLNIYVPDPAEPMALLYSGDQVEGNMITIVEPINLQP